MTDETKTPIVGGRMEFQGQDWEITRVDDFRDFWDVRLRSDGGVLARTKIAKPKSNA